MDKERSNYKNLREITRLETALDMSKVNCFFFCLLYSKLHEEHWVYIWGKRPKSALHVW